MMVIKLISHILLCPPKMSFYQQVGSPHLSGERQLTNEIPKLTKTFKFIVYKVTHQCGDGMKGVAMFIGDNQSICVSTKDFPKCLPNCYTDNCHLYRFPSFYGHQDVEDKSFDKHYIIIDPAQKFASTHMDHPNNMLQRF